MKEELLKLKRDLSGMNKISEEELDCLISKYNLLLYFYAVKCLNIWSFIPGGISS